MVDSETVASTGALIEGQIEEAEKALYRLSDTARYGEGPLDFAESLRRTIQSAERAQARGGRISGVASGFSDIDSLRRFIKDQNLRFRREPAGQGGLLLVSSGEIGRASFGAGRFYAEFADVFERDLPLGVEAKPAVGKKLRMGGHGDIGRKGHFENHTVTAAIRYAKPCV